MKRLIETEGSRNPMTIAELRSRVADWFVSGAWSIEWIDDAAAHVGYTVYQLRRDEYDATRSVAHIRQLFVESAHRNGGVGTALAIQRFPKS